MAKKSKLQKMQAKCQHEKTEIRKMNSLRFNLCLNCGHKELIEDLTLDKKAKENQGTRTDLLMNSSKSSKKKDVAGLSKPTKPPKESEISQNVKSISEKKPKAGSMLDVVLQSFPKEGQYTYEELLKLFRTTNDDMSKRADSSIKTVIKELVIGSKASPHINRYACLKFDEASKKFRRI